MSQTTEQQSSGKHPDRAVSTAEEDCYGFTHIATELARAIQGIGREGSAVIGIEGAWGTGKTSLLNLLRLALDEQKEERTYVLNISPWLDGSDTPLVSSLLLPVAGIIAEEEEKRLSSRELKALRKNKKVTDTARTLMDYTRATARTLAPVAQAAAVIPGVPDASGALKALSAPDWLKGKEQTTAEMRAHIAAKINKLDLSFIVLLDDLDRLEPAQAVEVIRLVKSVADFPRFRYLLCYDKAVLSQAISQGLGVADGSLYLQKIVQISFGLPRPETFVLRREFRKGALALWQEVNEGEPDDELISVLAQYTDSYGEALSSPREVKQVLNAVRFRYPGLRDYVYFPDLCLIQLLATVNPALARWVEHYLTDWSIVVMRDGYISDEKRLLLKEKLIQALSQFGAIRAHSVWELHGWLPGIDGIDEKTLNLFGLAPENGQDQSDSRRRLSSPVYWRYYFSFSAPQNVMSDADIQEILSLASGDYTALEKRLLDSVTANGVSSRTWFEHILARLTPAMTMSAGYRAQRNLLLFFFQCSDLIFPAYRERSVFFRPEELGINTLVSQLVRQMRQKLPELAMCYISRIFRDATAFAWAVTYLHDIAKQGDGDPISREELSDLRLIMKIRLDDESTQLAMADIPYLSSFLYACRDIISQEKLSSLIVGPHLDDRAFLQILLNLRSPVSHSHLGVYQRLDLEGPNNTFGIVGIESRLAKISSGGGDAIQNMFSEVENAIRMNKA